MWTAKNSVPTIYYKLWGIKEISCEPLSTTLSDLMLPKLTLVTQLFLSLVITGNLFKYAVPRIFFYDSSRFSYTFVKVGKSAKVFHLSKKLSLSLNFPPQIKKLRFFEDGAKIKIRSDISPPLPLLVNLDFTSLLSSISHRNTKFFSERMFCFLEHA